MQGMPISPYLRDLRALVGHRRLLVPSVAGIIRDGDRVLLVQDRESGKWSTPGGSIEMDETPVQSVVREVLEETGLHVVPERLLAVYGGPDFVVRYPNGDETQYVSAMFECRVESGELRPDGDETRSLQFLTLDEAQRLHLSPWLVPVIAQVFDGTIGRLTQGTT